jgi:sporulation protein YlmC with PRC-barrel domain
LPHAVTIDDPSVVRSDVAVAAWRGALLDLESLLQRTVITEGGRLIGLVGAIEFEAATSGLAALDVIDVHADRHIRIDADEIQTIGDEFIVITHTASADRKAAARPQRAPHLIPFLPALSTVESWPNVRQRISA